MDNVKQVYSASINLTRILLKYAADKGIKTKDLLAAEDFDSFLLGNDEKRISLRQFSAVWMAVEKQANDTDFGLHLGEEGLSHPAGNILILLMMNSPTIESAIDKYCRYHNIMADIVSPSSFIDGDSTHLRWEPRHPKIKLPRHHAEAILSMFCSILYSITDEKFSIKEVRFNHAEPDDINEHKRIFRSSILFNQPVNEIIIETTKLNLPIFLANPELLAAFEKVAQKSIEKLSIPNTWVDKVIPLFNDYFLRGTKPVIDEIATKLAVSTRNLQLRLKSEDTTFQNLLDQVRKELALNYIKTPDVTICDMAFLLGFSDQSSFNHAFKRWTGGSPGQFKKEMCPR